MDHLVTLVGEKLRSGCKKPPIWIRGGAVDVPDGGKGAAKGHHPEDHRGKSRRPHSRRRGHSERKGSGRRG
jgi:hypothetical protein